MEDVQLPLVYMHVQTHTWLYCVHLHTQTLLHYRVTATAPQFTAPELFLRNYKALFLCLKYTSSDSTLCSTQLTPSLSFSPPSFTYTHSVLHHSELTKNNKTHTCPRTHFLLITGSSLFRCLFLRHLTILTFQHESYFFLPELTRGLIHSSPSSLTARTLLQLLISLPLDYLYLCICPHTGICSVCCCLPLLFFSFY